MSTELNTGQPPDAQTPNSETKASDPLVAQLTALVEALEAKHEQQVKARTIPADVPQFVSR